MNVPHSTVEEPLEILRVSHEVEIEQNRALGERRSERNAAAAATAVARMAEVARTSENVVPAMLDAVRAEATLGEICDALRDVWGRYREPARFCRSGGCLRRFVVGGRSAVVKSKSAGDERRAGRGRSRLEAGSATGAADRAVTNGHFRVRSEPLLTVRSSGESTAVDQP